VLIEKAAAVESDFYYAKRIEFKNLLDKIRTMTPGQVQGDEGRQRLLEAIRGLTSFLEERINGGDGARPNPNDQLATRLRSTSAQRSSRR
jgi:hypothetical protein